MQVLQSALVIWVSHPIFLHPCLLNKFLWNYRIPNPTGIHLRVQVKFSLPPSLSPYTFLLVVKESREECSPSLCPPGPLISPGRQDLDSSYSQRLRGGARAPDGGWAMGGGPARCRESSLRLHLQGRFPKQLGLQCQTGRGHLTGAREGRQVRGEASTSAWCSAPLTWACAWKPEHGWGGVRRLCEVILEVTLCKQWE